MTYEFMGEKKPDYSTPSYRINSLLQVHTAWFKMFKLLTFSSHKGFANLLLSKETMTIHLKGLCRRVFDPRNFFSSINPTKGPIHGIKSFRIWLPIRRDNQLENRPYLILLSQ
jgi:hypothetical protein